jgi:predicted enzyme related to lactoylglutathione lyase
MVGEIVHIELPSRDFARSATFYAKLFGWKTDGVQSGGHLLVDLPGGVQGSWIRDALAQAPGPVPFVAVSDVDKTLAEAEKQGGRILVQRMTLANRGVFGLIADCDGNVLGVITTRDGSGKSESESKAGIKPEATPDQADRAETKAPGRPIDKTTVKAATKGGAKPAVAKKPGPRKR